MHIILNSGTEALAALSMNHIHIAESGEMLEVQLRDPDWADKYLKKLDRLFDKSQLGVVTNGRSEQDWTAININIDGESSLVSKEHYNKIILLSLTEDEEEDDDGGASSRGRVLAGEAASRSLRNMNLNK